MEDDFCGRVTIRLPEDKLERYKEFKELVTHQLHSDVCYVLGELMESFTVAVKETKEPPIQMIFPKQNIQINMGCTFHYNVKRARRLGEDQKGVVTDLNHVFPEVINQWPKLNLKAQAYWFKVMQDAGIIPPASATKPKPNNHQKPQKHGRLYDFCHRLRKLWMLRER